MADAIKYCKNVTSSNPDVYESCVSAYKGDINTCKKQMGDLSKKQPHIEFNVDYCDKVWNKHLDKPYEDKIKSVLKQKTEKVNDVVKKILDKTDKNNIADHKQLQNAVINVNKEVDNVDNHTELKNKTENLKTVVNKIITKSDPKNIDDHKELKKSVDELSDEVMSKNAGKNSLDCICLSKLLKLMMIIILILIIVYVYQH